MCRIALAVSLHILALGKVICKKSDLSQLSYLITIRNELLQKLAYNVLDIKSEMLQFVK